jgi:hypothetical protein
MLSNKYIKNKTIKIWGATCMPFLYTFTPSTIQLAPSQSSGSFSLPTYPNYFPPHEPIKPHLHNVHVPTTSHNIFIDFLQSWAQNPNNPSLHNKLPPPFHFAPHFTQAHISSEKPVTDQPSYLKSTRKLTSHTHSRFRSYDLSRHHSHASSSPSLSTTSIYNAHYPIEFSP